MDLRGKYLNHLNSIFFNVVGKARHFTRSKTHPNTFSIWRNRDDPMGRSSHRMVPYPSVAWSPEVMAHSWYNWRMGHRHVRPVDHSTTFRFWTPLVFFCYRFIQEAAKNFFHGVAGTGFQYRHVGSSCCFNGGVALAHSVDSYLDSGILVLALLSF